MVAKDKLKFDCLLEVEQQMKDIYYHYLLHRGLLDFIEQLITPPESVVGLRLSEHPTYRPMIELKSIRADNCVRVLGQLHTWANIAQHSPRND